MSIDCGQHATTPVQPTWGATSAAKAIPGLTGGINYHPATNRYLETNNYGATLDNSTGQIQWIGVFDAPQPWGPWTTVFYTNAWGPSGAPYGAGESEGLHFPGAWMSSDGTTVWSVFSSSSTSPLVGDALNLMKATLTLNNAGVTVNSPIAYAQAKANVSQAVYADRNYTLKTLSSNLVGGELIQTANDDKTSAASTQLSLTLASPSTVYVAYDPTISPPASWLSSWTLDASSVFQWSTSSGSVDSFHVYKKSFPAGTVALGGNVEGTTGPAAGWSNYSVVVQPTGSSQPSPVAWWKLDEGTGSSASDASGHGNTGTLVGSPAWTAGEFGEALAFDGTSNAYVDFGNPTDLRRTGSMTVSAWVKANDFSTVADMPIVSKRSPSNRGWQLYTDGNSAVFDIALTSSTYTTVYSGTALQTGTWYHLVAVYDAPGKSLMLYVNGIEDSVAPVTVTAQFDSANDVHLGNSAGCTTRCTYSQLFDGTIDEARVYDVALTASQVQAIP